MRFALIALALACAHPASAATLRVYGGPRGEELLRRYVAGDARLKARFDDAAKREAAFLAERGDSDLRDAVSDRDPDDLKRKLAVAAADKRPRVLEQLPGMKPAKGSFCAALADCSTPDMALDVADAAQLPESVRRMVRPWMLLQQARGKGIELSPASDGDAALRVTLRGTDAAPLTLNVAPRLLGGFKIWFDQPLVLASLYGRERDAALRR